MQVQNHDTIPELWGGIECTINRVQDKFLDQLESSGHYNRPDDVSRLISTGIKKIRYPLLWEKHQPRIDDVIDWRWSTGQLQQFQRNNVEVIAGLVHHGSGPAFTNLLDDQFPCLLAAYADKVIHQFPFLNYFTPVNEPLTTARLSGLYGLWYPHDANDRSFLKMLLNQLKGVVLSMLAIRRVNPAAKLVQTEDLGKTYSTNLLRYQAEFENNRRWLTYDLLCGKVNKDHPLWNYLLRNGINESEIRFFEENVCVPDIFGYNHYLTSERYIDERLELYPEHTHGSNGIHVYADVEAVRIELKEKTGLAVLLSEAWERYRKPLAVTEVHLHCHREEQLRWFRHVWSTCKKLAEEGVRLEAVTAWAMLGSYGWNRLLTSPGGEYEPGVFDVRSGTPRPTAIAHYLTNLAKEAHHPVSNSNGWWHRPTRFLHKPSLLQNRVDLKFGLDSAPLLIIGKNGRLGNAFARMCRERFIDFRLVGRDECNIGDPASIEQVLKRYRPWAIVNGAGFVHLDEAEFQPQKCFSENTKAAYNLAVATAKSNTKLLTFSTDLVFDGKKHTPYTEENTPNPTNTYGLSKARAEQEVLDTNPDALIIRSGPFFGPWDEDNFANRISRSLINEENIAVAKDATVSPTYLPDMVHAVLDLIIDNEKGIWHMANQGELTWVDFANEIADRSGLDRQYIKPVLTDSFNFPAKRPLYTVLTSHRGIFLPSIEDALRRYVADMSPALQNERAA